MLPVGDSAAAVRGTPARVDPIGPPRFSRRFRTRVFLYIVAMSLTTSIASAGVYYWRQLGFIAKDRNRRARTLLTSLATQSELGAYAGDPTLCELAAHRTFNEEDVALVAIYDRRGRELLHFTAPDMPLPPPSLAVLRHMLSHPASEPQRTPGDGFDDLYVPIVTATRDAAEAIVSGPGHGPTPRLEAVGVARVGLSLQPVREQLTEVILWGAYLAAGLLLVGIAAALLISRRVSRPIAELKRGTDEVSAGNLDTRVEIRAEDELGQLGYAFNRMAARLADTMTALETQSRDLEAEVARRTLVIQRAAQFSALLNAPVGEPVSDAPIARAPGDGAPSAGGLARGALARLLDEALGLLVSGTRARAAAVLLAREESVELELEVSWCRGVAPEALGALPSPELIAAGAPVVDGDRLMVPLLLGREPEGAIVLLLDRPPREDEVQFVVHAASQLAIAVSNVRAYSTLSHLARELKERNAALAQQRDQLREMNRLKSEFLANTSHELRTPLNAILGYAELVGDGLYGPVTDGQKEALHGIDESSKNLLRLIDEILDLAKVEAGKMTIELDEVDVADVARGVLLETAPLAKDRPYAVKLDVFGRATVRTDREKLKQILTNLVANAIKFTAAGAVEVTVRAEPGGGCTIAVRDTGIGIRMEDQKIIFEEFRQVDGSYTRAYGGSGLGLAIARRLATLLGAELGVESALGVGSTFTVRLPHEPSALQLAIAASSPAAAGATAPGAAPGPPARRVTIPPPLPPEARDAKSST